MVQHEIKINLQRGEYYGFNNVVYGCQTGV